MGVAGLALMTDHAHDVRLMTVIVNGIAHRFPINGQALIMLTIGLVPSLDCLVELHRVHSNQNITDDGQAWHNESFVFVATVETLPGLLAQAFGPIRDGEIASHATQ